MIEYQPPTGSTLLWCSDDFAFLNVPIRLSKGVPSVETRPVYLEIGTEGRTRRKYGRRPDQDKTRDQQPISSSHKSLPPLWQRVGEQAARRGIPVSTSGGEHGYVLLAVFAFPGDGD